MGTELIIFGWQRCPVTVNVTLRGVFLGGASGRCVTDDSWVVSCPVSVYVTHRARTLYKSRTLYQSRAKEDRGHTRMEPRNPRNIHNDRNDKYRIHNFEKSGKVANFEKVGWTIRFFLMPKQLF